MKTILHVSNLNVINGTLIDSLEYWLYLQDRGEFVWYMTNMSPKFLKAVIDSRYHSIKEEIFDYIVPINLKVPSKILMFGSTYMKVGHQVSNIPIRCIPTYSSQHISHPVFLANYHKKIYLDKLRCRSPIRAKYLHRSSFDLKEECPTLKYLDDERDPIIVYVSPQFKDLAEKKYSNHNNIKFIYGGVIPQFFDQFDELVYLYERSDFSPRLFIECAYLKKKITYVGPIIEGDGSANRFLDAKSGHVNKYKLTLDDRAVSWLLS